VGRDLTHARIGDGAHARTGFNTTQFERQAFLAGVNNAQQEKVNYDGLGVFGDHIRRLTADVQMLAAGAAAAAGEH
jgi:hypothetical protein